ncbi:NACHT, LRR and PYD domains-containing protein 12-like isoform X1 [Pocillopora verrucosa]|uniref:NACHT, LRR and PYD domains-containing protein 12-like isoform X1 n=2 Tax=Pocillopora verrucosa TaxID=203993 RepID=UPI0033427865
MDNLKELLKPKTFNTVSHAVVVIWILIGVIFLGIFADAENSESRYDFRCGGAKSENIDLVRGRCFELYEKQYNKHDFPIYAFVIMNFFLIGTVCAIYSQIASLTINQLSPSARNRDLEGQLRDQGNVLSSKKLFIAYCCQLFARIVLGVLFMVLQKQFIYPRDFPPNFPCYLTSGGSQPRNSTGVWHDCHNQRATKKNSWMRAVLVVNGIFLFGILLETVYILLRARKEDSFMKNSNFLKAHLNPFHADSQNATTSTLSRPEPPQQEKRTEQETQQLRKPPLQEFIENTKEIIKEETNQPPQLRSPFSSTPGEGRPPKHLTLDQIYTNLVVVPDMANYDFTGDRRQKLEVYTRSGGENTTPRGPEDILNHENKNVLIVGRPGIGKTLCCTKLLRDWAFNKVFHESSDDKIHFDAAFFIKFRAFNAATDLSLRELLTSSEHSHSDHIDDEVWNYILENPQRVLLIFDGIDEFKLNSKIGEENFEPQFKNCADKKMPLYALYEKLATGKLLNGAAVLTTTRPTALSCIERVNFDKVFEILGFSSEQVEEYVTKFAEEEKHAGETIWRHIGGNTNILSLCYIPASCFIICSSLFQMAKFYGSKSLSLPTKLTDIYKKAVKIFYLRHSEEFRGKNFTREDFESDNLPPNVEKKFEKLEKMAFEGIKEGRLVFGGNEVRGLEGSALFHRLPDRETTPLKREQQFCFIHLTMQEFFAARHLANMNEKKLRNFVSTNIADGKWQLVFQFLAGLMNEKENLPSEIITDLLPVETEEKENVWYNEEWTFDMEPRKVTCWPTEDKKHLAVTLFKCINESSEMEEIVQRKLQQINFNFVNFNDCQLTPVDCASVVTVIKNVQQISHLGLAFNNFGPLGCFEICKLLKCSKSQLSWLDLRGNQLTDEAAKYLADAINNNNCQLRTLNLARNNISHVGAQHLAEAINNNNCQLRSLDLRANNISHIGAQHLAEAINNNNCQLRTLILRANNISHIGAQHLADAINNNNCQLHTLHLADNNISDIGAQHLAEAINNNNCQLRTLDLGANNISDIGAQHLAEAINNNNCQLRTLDLTYNNISDIGAQHLAEAINNNNCQLHTLRLKYNKITEAGKQHANNLLSNSQSNCRLII